LLTKSVTFLHLGQLQLRIKFAMSAYIAHLWQWLNRKKTAVAVFFYHFIYLNLYYQNFHQGLLEDPVCFTLLVEVAPVAWPVTLSFR
jgi:hypothetical protein